MARQIKDTPIITGKDADRFAKKIANPKPASPEDIRRARAIYEAVKAQSKFVM